MNIGEVASQIGLPAKTIRYYEDIGLVTPQREANGYRVFRESDAHKLAFLARARALGFSIDDCRNLLALWEDRSRASADVRAIAKQHLAEIEEKIEHATDELLRRADHLRSHPGQVSFPGGKIDPGETAVESAVRETDEEQGIRVLEPRKMGELWFAMSDIPDIHCHVFMATSFEGEPVETEEIELPDRVFNPKYERRVLPKSLYVPEHY